MSPLRDDELLFEVPFSELVQRRQEVATLKEELASAQERIRELESNRSDIPAEEWTIRELLDLVASKRRHRS